MDQRLLHYIVLLLLYSIDSADEIDPRFEEWEKIKLERQKLGSECRRLQNTLKELEESSNHILL